MSDVFETELAERVGRAARQWSAHTRLGSLQPVTKGSSSLTYKATLYDEATDGRTITSYVKVAPPGLPPVRNRDVLRQARVLDVLAADGAVPVPGVLFRDAGAPPETPPFFAAQAVAGECLEPLVDDADLPDAAVLSARARDAAETLARLHRVDVADLAGPNAPAHADLAREVDRWDRVFATIEGGPSEQGHACGRLLRDTVPVALPPVVVHGDYRLGNIMCGNDGVHAILDWEIWSLTDPRIDVAWLLMTLSADGLPSAIRRSAPGLPSPDEVLDTYTRASGARVTDLPWFSALSRFRAAAAMALNIKHNRRRPAPNPRIEAYAERLPQFLDVAAGLITRQL